MLDHPEPPTAERNMKTLPRSSFLSFIDIERNDAKMGSYPLLSLNIHRSKGV